MNRITLFRIITSQIKSHEFNQSKSYLIPCKQNDKKKKRKKTKEAHFNFIPPFKEPWIRVKLLLPLPNSPKSQEHRKFSTTDETIPSLHPPLPLEARQLYWKPAETENNFVSISSSLQKRIHEAAVKEQAWLQALTPHV